VKINEIPSTVGIFNDKAGCAYCGAVVGRRGKRFDSRTYLCAPHWEAAFKGDHEIRDALPMLFEKEDENESH